MIKLAREALGGEIHLDPSSSEDFNQRVNAWRIITEQENGLTSNWSLSPSYLMEVDSWPVPHELAVLINPPGRMVKAFWNKLIHEFANRSIGKAIWIGFSVEQLCVLADEELYPLDFSTVILRKRIAFTREDGSPGETPSHGNYITGLGIDPDVFTRIFGKLGKIHHGVAITS